jgi:hypothetical protein
MLFLVVAGLYIDPNVFPHVRPSPSETFAKYGRPTLDEERGNDGSELNRWCKQFTDGAGKGRIPLYLVSAEGGGIRAGYWSAAILAELDAKTNGEFRKHVFALSGVSGGSLGVAAFTTAAFRNNEPPGRLGSIMNQYFGNDFLSPLVARFMITEPLRMGLGDASHVEPRDRVFEETLSHDWKLASGKDDFSQPFLETFGTQESSQEFVPIVWFNSTIVETGLRAIVSNIPTYPIAGLSSSDLLRRDAGADVT